jgi:hypothetical protein
MQKHALRAAMVMAVLIGAATMVLAASRGHQAVRNIAARPHAVPAASVVRSTRANAAGWQMIKGAAQMRRMALEPNRTSFYRAFAGYIGLSALIRLDRILPGRCSLAVRFLYNNLLDLYHAQSGEDWDPLRRAVATEPPLGACAPRPRLLYVG